MPFSCKFVAEFKPKRNDKNNNIYNHQAACSAFSSIYPFFRNCSAREKNSLEIAFYTNPGYRHLSFGNLYSEFNNRDIATVNGAFSLGAGSFVSNGKWLVGLDFYNSRGTSENDAYTTKFNAITNALFFGYRVVSTESLNLAPFVGVSNTTTSLNMFEKANENPDFTTFNAFEVNNMDFSARLGLQFEVVFKNKMSFGVSTGYDFTLMGETDWEFEGNSSETLISDRQGGFFINILLGGHLKLK